MQSWLQYQGRADLQACDGELLQGGFEKLTRDCLLLAEAAKDFSQELKLP